MPLPSFLKRFRAGQTNEVVASAATPSEEARTRARRRLIGAAVLVAAGVVGFPLLFDSQPRPLPSDLPIVMQHKDGGREVDVPRVAAVTRVDEPAAAAHPVAEDDGAAAPAPATTPSTAASSAARSVVPAAKPAAAVAAKPSASVKPEAPAKPASKPEPVKPANKPNPSDKTDAVRAQALLNGQDAAKPASSSTRAASAADMRYIVQIGAFADVPKAREARLKVEKLGLKTYTQVVNGDEGKRIRVRVGPFPDKEAAEKAAGKIRQAGLTAAILTL